MLYHGTQQERTQIRKTGKWTKSKLNYQVLITSFEISIKDSKHLKNIPWKYLVVDEGHRLKNLDCKLIKYFLIN